MAREPVAPRPERAGGSRLRLALASGAAVLAGGAAGLLRRHNPMQRARAEAEGGPPEPSGVWTGRILLVIAGWTVFVGAGLAAIGALTASRVSLSSPAQDVHPFSEPQLQRDPQGDLARLLAAQRARLDGYAWVDRSAGLVHVPIERAMEAIVARGPVAFAPLRGEPGPDTARRRAVEAEGLADEGRGR